MARRHPSAVRQHRRSLRRAAINKRNTSEVRTQVKKVREAVEGKDYEAARKLLPGTFSVIDEAVKKGTLHANTGGRYKSRLSREVETLKPAPPAAK